MTERVMLSNLSERTAYGVSRLRKDIMKTIPELYVEEMTVISPF